MKGYFSISLLFLLFSSLLWGEDVSPLVLEPEGRYIYQAAREESSSGRQAARGDSSTRRESRGQAGAKSTWKEKSAESSKRQVDHLLDGAEISGNRMIVNSSTALTLIDLDTMSLAGSKDNLFRNTRSGGRDLVVYQDKYIYLNQHQSSKRASTLGFGMARIDGNEIVTLNGIAEEDTFYEKMELSGSRLYVAAHDKGIRIYSLENPEKPKLVGSLEEGFTDAFDLAVSGDLLYVADGAGGLKIVDISDVESPGIIAGETSDSAAGTAQSVEVQNGIVYLASGGAGVCAYLEGDIESREIFPLDGCAEDMCLIGDYLVVSTFSGVAVLAPGEGTALSLAAWENLGRTGSGASIRTSFGVGSLGDDRLLVSSWNSTDVFRLVPREESSVTDINLSSQRLRFPAEGGEMTLTVNNSGASDLLIDRVDLPFGDFSTDLAPCSLAPGESLTFSVRYRGGKEDQSRIMLISSNDPDESIIPIQLFGKTSTLDPGETVPDFTLPLLGEPEGEQITLSDYNGKIIWVQVFGTWCPACPSAEADMQSSIIKYFEDNPQVETWIINQADKEGETEEWVDFWSDRFYQRAPLLFDEDGSVGGEIFGQPDVGNMPFGRGFIIDGEGTVVKAFFGHQPQMVVETIESLLEGDKD
ncbi:MAG: redoxin domain-containing protein [Spirochaetales bacterium]|nr:redoxin domain-containing protein [Spirochaetales bacterium]